MRSGALAVLAAAAPLAAAAAVTVLPPAPARPVPQAADEVPVSSTLLACTTHGAGPGAGGTRYASATAPVPGAEGDAAVSDLGSPRGDVVVVDGPGAVGLVAWRADVATTQAATTPCPEPRTSWWFGGAGGGLDHHSDVVLSNVDEAPAVVDVTLVGATGRVDDAALRDLTVPAGGSRVVPLVEVAPRSDELTVHVEAAQGRVVAQVRDTLRTLSGAGAGVGTEWLPPSAPPATDVLATGIPAGAGRRTLLVTNPGDQQALVSVQVVTDDGAFVPSGGEDLSLDPGAIGEVDLAAVGRRFAGVRVRSETSVLATVRSHDGSDVGYAAAAPAATGYLAAATTGRTNTLLLQGADDPTGAEVTAVSAAGRVLASRGLSVPPSGVVTWDVPPRTAYVLLRPDTGRGDLVAAVVSTGPGLTVVPLTVAPTTELRPSVRQRTEE